MKETVNYKLKKPELSDVVNIDDLNSNMDILDKEVKNIDTKKVDKVSGKGLSTNDYTNTDKSEVAKIKDKADKTYVDEEVSKAGKVKSVNGLEGDVVLHGGNIKVNATSSETVNNALDKKVDKASGKGLSTNDYTNTDKSEVAKIKDKADKTDIKNKASISHKTDINRVTTEHSRQVNASDAATANSPRSQVNASRNCVASGNDSQVNASSYSTASGSSSQVNASSYSTASGSSSQVMVSSYVINDVSDSVAGGYSHKEPSGTQNRKWEINSYQGTIKASGSITGNSSFADFAEYMESEDSKAIPFGTMVTLSKGQKIRIAEDGDIPVGVISATAGVILNAQGFEWADRYLYDRYGQPILVEQEVNGEIMELPMINPDYDPDVEYIPREDRPEWNVVGMKGQIYVNIDDTVEEGGYVKPTKHGVATRGIIVDEYDGVQATKMWKVMEITTPYEEELGHGIARIII